MTVITALASTISKKLSKGTKLFLSAVLLLALALCVGGMDSDYTTKSYVGATVIAKTQMASASKSQSRPHFILALRHPDGTLQDVQTSFAQYSVTPVGGTWGVMSSPSLRGLPSPWYEKVRLAVIVALLIGFALAAAGALTSWLFDDTSER